MSDRRPCARRLTLAPEPRQSSPTGSCEEGCGHGAAMMAKETEVIWSCLPQEEWLADPLAGQRRNLSSKFWPLTDELSSDDESGDVGTVSGGRRTTPGLPASEDIAAAERPQHAAELRPKVSPSSCNAGKDSGLLVNAEEFVADRRRPSKPWQGPLPARRISPAITLGDALDKAWSKCSSRTSEGASLQIIGPALSSSPVVSSPTPARAKVSRQCCDSNFESRKQQTRDPGGVGQVVGLNGGPQTNGPIRSIVIKNGPNTARFTLTPGLVQLFTRAGRLRTRVFARASQNIHAATPSPQRDCFSPLADSQPMQAAGAGVGGGGRGTDHISAMERAGSGGCLISKVGGHGGGRERGSGSGGAGGNKEEEFLGGADLPPLGFGFDPGFGGYGHRGSRGRGWQHRGFRPRGARGFGPRRGGFAGRLSRTGGTGGGGRGGGAGGVAVDAFVGAGAGSYVAATTNVGSVQQAAPNPALGKTNKVSFEANEMEYEEDVGRPGNKSKQCLRCSQKGHLASECANEVYCDICDGHDHVNHRCPILKMPRPVAHAVGYAVAGLEFYHIPHQPLTKKKDTKMALVKVVGGCLSPEKIVVQLQKIVPGKWKWEPEVQDDASFVVMFPSKAELQRALNFGSIDVRENGVSTGVLLKFEEWHDKEEGFLLPKVWVQVTGIRRKLREFLNLWAIGSLLGSTQTVDMKTTRKSNFGRILVAVLDPMLLPSNLDVVIGDHYFELKFKIEKVVFDGNGDEVEMNFMDSEDKGNEEMGEERPHDAMDREPKRSRSDDVAMEGDGTFSPDANGNHMDSHVAPNAELEAKIRIWHLRF